MISLRSQDGKIIIKDGKLGTEQACCCGQQQEYCGQGWVAFADGYPPDESCVCPDVLGGGTHPGNGGAVCDSCPTTPYFPFKCLSDAQEFAANYPEANWSYGPVPVDGFDPDTGCFPDVDCLYLDSNPLP